MAREARIVALGPEQEIAGLASIGVELVPVESGGELGEALEEQTRDPGARIVLVSESVAEGARDVVADMRSRTGAVIALVPSHRGPRGMAVEWIRRAMEQSIGVDMISED